MSIVSLIITLANLTIKTAAEINLIVIIICMRDERKQREIK